MWEIEDVTVSFSTGGIYNSSRVAILLKCVHQDKAIKNVTVASLPIRPASQH